MACPSLRQKLDSGAFILAPGVFDLMTTLIANTHGFAAHYASGYWNMASLLGEADVGIGTYRDFEMRFRQIVEKSTAPVIADADTGFGGLINLEYCVRGYERIGVTAIQIEDQEFPKKCGHTEGKRVVPTEDMVKRIRVAVDTRSSPDFLVIARTDARAVEGLDAALARADAYATAGADILFVESPMSEEEMRRICAANATPQLINMAHGGKTPILSQAVLQEIGFRIAIFPAAAPLSAMHAANQMYAALRQTGDASTSGLPIYDFARMSELLGFPEVYAFEEKYGR